MSEFDTQGDVVTRVAYARVAYAMLQKRGKLVVHELHVYEFSDRRRTRGRLLAKRKFNPPVFVNSERTDLERLATDTSRRAGVPSSVGLCPSLAIGLGPAWTSNRRRSSVGWNSGPSRPRSRVGLVQPPLSGGGMCAPWEYWHRYKNACVPRIVGDACGFKRLASCPSDKTCSSAWDGVCQPKPLTK